MATSALTASVMSGATGSATTATKALEPRTFSGEDDQQGRFSWGGGGKRKQKKEDTQRLGCGFGNGSGSGCFLFFFFFWEGGSRRDSRTRAEGHGILIRDPVRVVRRRDRLSDPLGARCSPGVVPSRVSDVADRVIETQEISDQELCAGVARLERRCWGAEGKGRCCEEEKGVEDVHGGHSGGGGGSEITTDAGILMLYYRAGMLVVFTDFEQWCSRVHYEPRPFLCQTSSLGVFTYDEDSEGFLVWQKPSLSRRELVLYR